MIKVPSSVLSNLEAALSREWLVTNGSGGYASSTIIGTNTRRYHGLLVASFPPPLERQVLLAKVDEELAIGSEVYPLGANEYHDGTIHPHGHRFPRSFRLELGIPTFEYHVDGVTLVKQVWMEHGRSTVYVLYRLLDAPCEASLRIRPFCTFRGYHHDGRRGKQEEYVTLAQDGQVIVESAHAPYSLKMLARPQGEFEPGDDCYRGFLYRAERDRGFDCLEDLYTPGVFIAHLSSGESVGLVATSERHSPGHDLDGAFGRELARRRALVRNERNSFRRKLLLAADQFVINPPGHGSKRRAILAGYHWFTDWGRDTMIGLPGLLLSTGRFSEAREILLRYIEWADGGMVPNRFTDEGSAEYNTADATLWYFQALHAYITASGDRDILQRLFTRLREIVDWHFQGTRFGIRVDPSDGLLFAGRDGSWVTWMDACVDGFPVTPRIGKPVETNALWFNALSLMSSWAQQLGKADSYASAAAECQSSFRRRFRYGRGRYLYDVIDGPAGRDSSLRPNQIMAVSLAYSPLGPSRQKAVVDAVERALLTPYGLRSLSPDDPKYIGIYHGGPAERDHAYHQGTVWPWLLGQFADAHYRVYRDRDRIAALLKSLRRHLAEAGIGSISEVFDGDSPHNPRGCIAQAWSVAEILRICTDLMREA